VEHGQTIVLTYRGRRVARLEPIGTEKLAEDPFYRLADYAESGCDSLTNQAIDGLIYRAD